MLASRQPAEATVGRTLTRQPSKRTRRTAPAGHDGKRARGEHETNHGAGSSASGQGAGDAGDAGRDAGRARPAPTRPGLFSSVLNRQYRRVQGVQPSLCGRLQCEDNRRYATVGRPLCCNIRRGPFAPCSPRVSVSPCHAACCRAGVLPGAGLVTDTVRVSSMHHQCLNLRASSAYHRCLLTPMPACLHTACLHTHTFTHGPWHGGDAPYQMQLAQQPRSVSARNRVCSWCTPTARGARYKEARGIQASSRMVPCRTLKPGRQVRGVVLQTAC